MSNVDQVLETLRKSNRPLKGMEISEKSGVDKKEVDKIIKTLRNDYKIFSPKRYFYKVK